MASKDHLTSIEQQKSISNRSKEISKSIDYSYYMNFNLVESSRLNDQSILNSSFESLSMDASFSINNRSISMHNRNVSTLTYRIDSVLRQRLATQKSQRE